MTSDVKAYLMHQKEMKTPPCLGPAALELSPVMAFHHAIFLLHRLFYVSVSPVDLELLNARFIQPTFIGYYYTPRMVLQFICVSPGSGV